MVATQLINTFNNGGIIAYPTEAVFGLGCDPDNEQAIKKLLKIKQRSPDKGLILLAGSFEQLQPYVDISSLSRQLQTDILNRWPNAITQLLPVKNNISRLLTGKFNTLAVRVTTHPDIIELCRATGKPIISTSANLSGQPHLTTWQQVQAVFTGQVDYIIKSNTLGFANPSTIINPITGQIFR